MRHKSILTVIERSAFMFPQKTAAIDECEQLNYDQLLNLAKKIGISVHSLLQGELHKPIVLFMEKSCRCLAAMLGVLYSGNIYVPMDINTPRSRLDSILGTLESAVVLACWQDQKHLKEVGYTGELWVYEDLIGTEITETGNQILTDIQSKIIDTDLMYVLFTSGSTGTPKGVAITYRSVIDYVYAYKKAVEPSENDVMGNQAPFYADMSLKDIYMSLEAGAAICMIPQKYFMAPRRLMDYLEDNGVTLIAWVPTAYRIVAQFDMLSKIRPGKLKKFVFSGETMPIWVYQYWRSHYPEAEFIQQYGPTEITGACTSFRVTREYSEHETIPIGKPLENTGLMLLDEFEQRIPDSEPFRDGEICVWGSCLAAGYYNDPEKTAEAFIQNPLIRSVRSTMYRTGDLAHWDREGNLVFVSRKDDQIKLAGRRIELGEVEAAAQSIPAVSACCCVYVRERNTLALFFVGQIKADEIKEAIASKLPKYMIPSLYFPRNNLPQLPNGKIDRKQMNQWANVDRKMHETEA